MVNQTARPLSPRFLYAAGSLSEVMSHVSSSLALGTAAPERNDGEEGEEEDGGKDENAVCVCPSDHRQLLGSAPGRVSLFLFPLPPSVSLSLSLSLSRVAQWLNRRRRWIWSFLTLCYCHLQRPVPRILQSVHGLRVTGLCWRWVSAWWPTPLLGYGCTDPEGVCRRPDSVHLQKHTRTKVLTWSSSYWNCSLLSWIKLFFLFQLELQQTVICLMFLFNVLNCAVKCKNVIYVFWYKDSSLQVYNDIKLLKKPNIFTSEMLSPEFVLTYLLRKWNKLTNAQLNYLTICPYCYVMIRCYTNKTELN